MDFVLNRESDSEIVLKVTFENFAPIIERLLNCLIVIIITLIGYLYLTIIDFVIIRAMYISQRGQRTINNYYSDLE